MRARGVSPWSARPCSLTISSAAEASEICEAQAAVTRPPSVSVGSERILSQFGSRGPSSAATVAERHDLGVEAALGAGPDGPLVGLDRERLHVVAGDVPLLGDHLGRAELADLLRAVAGHPALGARERVVEAELLADEHGRGDRDLRHLLDAAGDDDVHRPRQHRLGREVDGLLGRAALAVDGGAGHVLGQAGGEPAGAGDVAGLAADGVDAAEHDVLDRGGVDAGPLDEGPERVGAQVGGVHLRQPAAAPPDRGAHCVDDVGLGHGVSSGSIHRISPRIGRSSDRSRRGNAVRCGQMPIDVGDSGAVPGRRRPTPGPAPRCASGRGAGRARRCSRWRRGTGGPGGPTNQAASDAMALAIDTSRPRVSAPVASEWAARWTAGRAKASSFSGVGQVVLHRLERPDRHAELAALGHVGDGQVEHPLAEPDEQRGGAERPPVERPGHGRGIVGHDGLGRRLPVDGGGAPGRGRRCRRG